MNILEVKNLCKTYLVNKRQNNVLKNVNFTVSEGEMTAVMGLLRFGQIHPALHRVWYGRHHIGEVLFCGKNITAMGERELADVRLDEMGFIFQQMYMLKNLTVLDNIILPRYNQKRTGRAAGRPMSAAGALMRRLGIDEVGGNDINEVSGGQLQRACICRSMINNPRMIFADEPTGALNRASSDEVMNELLSLNRDGTTIMCVTHDSKVAAKCSRVLYIVDGGIVGEKEMGHFGGGDKEFRDRERELNHWLMEQGW